VLVGRDHVLRGVDTALERAFAGEGRLVLLSGEAGIGKTSVARAVAARAEASGAVVRWGACWEGQDSVPFSLWIDCLRRPGGDVCAAAASHLEEGGFEAAADGGGAARGRLRLHAAVLDAIAEAAGSRPQVVILDDLHWADAPSVELLVALVARLPAMRVLLVGSYRDDELAPSSPLMGIGGNADRIALEGLAEPDVASLLSDVLGRPASGEEIRTVHRDTGGNPLFVTEVGRLVAGGSPPTVPSGVSAVLARRLARLSPACDRTLGAAAVVGATFDVETVAAMMGESTGSIAAAVDEALAARLVVRSEMEGTFSFVHPLFQAARYENLGSVERSTLHCRAFDALTASGTVAHGALVRHAQRGRFGAGDTRPAACVAAAARDAVVRLALDDAVRLAGLAIGLAPTGESGSEVRADAWLAAGDAHLRRGEPAAGVAFERAAAIGRARGRADIVARAALGFGAGLGGFEVRILDPRQVDLLEEAAGTLEEESPLRPLVLARLSVALSFVGSVERRLELADAAVAAARRVGDGLAVAAAIAARCDAIAGPDHSAERLGAASEVVALGQRAGNLPLELLGRRLRVVALFELRDLLALEAETVAFARSAAALGDPLYTWYVPMWQAMHAYADGRVEDAARQSAEAGAIGRTAGSLNADMLRITLALFMAVDRRDVDAIATIWQEMLGVAPEFMEITAPVFNAFFALHTGRIEHARAELDRGGSAALAAVARDQEWLTTVAQILAAAVAVDHEPVARQAFDLLAPYSGLGVFEGIAAVDHGVTDRYLAVGAAFLDDHHAARAYANAALELVSGAGRLVRAHTAADCARALQRSTDPADRRRAVELAHGARIEYEQLGFNALAQELLPLAGDVGGGAGQASAPTHAALERDGDTWVFTYDGTSARIRHAKGVADLAVLLARAGREVHVRELEGAAGIARPAGSEPAVDDRAVAQYRRRLRDLEQELDEADRHADAGRGAVLAAERDALVAELTRAFGLGGRRRPAGADPDERLRKAVSARVRSTIDRLDDLHPQLARHLRRSIRTGLWCAYEPERAVTWTVVMRSG
jgi:hypothetical protein